MPILLETRASLEDGLASLSRLRRIAGHDVRPLQHDSVRAPPVQGRRALLRLRARLHGRSADPPRGEADLRAAGRDCSAAACCSRCCCRSRSAVRSVRSVMCAIACVDRGRRRRGMCSLVDRSRRARCSCARIARAFRARALVTARPSPRRLKVIEHEVAVRRARKVVARARARVRSHRSTCLAAGSAGNARGSSTRCTGPRPLRRRSTSAGCRHRSCSGVSPYSPMIIGSARARLRDQAPRSRPGGCTDGSRTRSDRR